MTYIKKIVILFLVLLGSIAYTQNSFKAVYNYQDVINHTNVDYVLYYKDGLSKYVTHKKKERRIINNYQFDIAFSHIEYYYDINKKISYQYRILSDEKTPIVSKWNNQIKWNIHDTTKKISGYTVQKATSDYLSKDFPQYGKVVAWFTTDVPIGIGPTRNVGLPGLVVRIEYTGVTSVSCNLKSIDFEACEDIDINTDGIAVSKQDMIKPFNINKKWLKKQIKIYSQKK